MPKKENNVFWCIAEYEDGTVGYFGITCDVLPTSCELSLAEESQREGYLKSGKIIRTFMPTPKLFR
jgi:hypothetical protein